MDKMMVFNFVLMEVFEDFIIGEELFFSEGSVGKNKFFVCWRKWEFIFDEKKDVMYWEKRWKNNEVVKRFCEKC